MRVFDGGRGSTVQEVVSGWADEVGAKVHGTVDWDEGWRV